MQRPLIILGIILLVTGIFWKYIGQIPFGHLPGDIVIKRDNFTFYFPIVTMLLISLLLTVIIRLWNHWGK